MNIIKSSKDLVKGYMVSTIDGDKIIETHYAVYPDGRVLYAKAYNRVHFGPKNAEDWGQSSTLPACAEYIGNYYI